MISTKRILTFASIATLAAMLSACGGGSSPDPSNYVANPPQTPPPAPAYPTNAQRVTVTQDYNGAQGQSTKVAVLDTGVSSSHQEFTDNGGKNALGDSIISGGINAVNAMDNAYPTLTSTSGTLDTSDYQYNPNGGFENDHGNFVASIIGGAHIGFSGDASMYIEKISDNGTASGLVTAYAFGDAASKGNQFANLSWNLDPVSQYQYASDYEAGQGGFTSVNNMTDMIYASYQKVLTAGMGMIVAAGNASASFSATNNTASNWKTSNPVYSLTLIVGALDSDNSTLAGYSNYAGDDANVQARFITAIGTNTGADPSSNTAYNTFMGTSSATPVVTAAAATLKTYWSFMTPAQIEQRLLDTADKNFNSLWSQNNCGASGTENCGAYYYGQGRLDLAAAMQPAGVVVTSVAATVPTAPSAQSAPVQATSLSIPASMGNIAQQVRAASVGIRGFDPIGRDYELNLKPAITTNTDPSLSLSAKMSGFGSRFLQAGSAVHTLSDQ